MYLQMSIFNLSKCSTTADEILPSCFSGAGRFVGSSLGFGGLLGKSLRGKKQLFCQNGEMFNKESLKLEINERIHCL